MDDVPRLLPPSIPRWSWRVALLGCLLAIVAAALELGSALTPLPAPRADR